MKQLEVTDDELDKLSLDNISGDTKLKIVFNLETCNLEKTTQINKIIKKCKETFQTFQDELERQLPV